MPPVRNSQAASVQGRTQRAQEASILPVDQGCDGKGETDGKADIAEIEQRRMDREAEILQDRVQFAALEGRRHKPAKRV